MTEVNEKTFQELNIILADKLRKSVDDFITVDMENYNNAAQLAIIINGLIHLIVYLVHKGYPTVRITIIKKIVKSLKELDKLKSETGWERKRNNDP